MSEILTREEIKVLWSTFPKDKDNETPGCWYCSQRIAQAQLDHLKEQGWHSKEEIQQLKDEAVRKALQEQSK